MLGLAGKIALSSPPFGFKAFQPRMISPVAEAFPCPSFPGASPRMTIRHVYVRTNHFFHPIYQI
jgi:hypothetical protein